MKNKITFSLLVALTLLKVLFIFFFYQNLIVYNNSQPKIVRGYCWSELVESMHQGKYEMVMQTGLSDIYDLKTKAGRPPLYALLLFLLTKAGVYADFLGIFLQAIITSLVAYLGYKLVFLASNNEGVGQICLWFLFFFPLNLIKTGVVDEAPLMLFLLLASLYFLIKYFRNQMKYILLILSGILLGLSALTRVTTLLAFYILVVFLLLSRTFIKKKLLKIVLFAFIYTTTLSPWLIRNYLIYGKPALSVGGGRLFLITQSQEFIESFPERSVDDIEREYLRKFYESHQNLGHLDINSLDRAFTRYALSEIIHKPEKFLHSLLAKLKAFLPLRYYPKDNNSMKNIVFIISYSFVSLLFIWSIFWSIFKLKYFSTENTLLILAFLALFTPGIAIFILSRHLYPLIMIMLIFSFIANDHILKKIIKKIKLIQTSKKG